MPTPPSRHLQIRILLAACGVAGIPLILVAIYLEPTSYTGLMLIAVVTLAVAAAVAGSLSRHVTERLAGIQRAVEALADGRPAGPIVTPYGDEVDHVAAAVNRVQPAAPPPPIQEPSQAESSALPPATPEAPLRHDLVAHVEHAPSSLDVLRRVDEMLGRIKSTTQEIDDLAGEAEIELLDEAVDVLRTNAGRDENMSQHLAEVCDGLGRTHDTILGELGRLSDQVATARKFMRQQIRFEGTGVLEPLYLADLVDDAVRINRCELERSQVRVRRDYEDLPPVILDKLKVMHILINLVKTAADDLAEGPAADPHMELRLSFDDDAHIRVRIADNGAISATPEPDEPSAGPEDYPFGFRQCCKLATDMGGRVRAERPESGAGTSYVLEFPCRPLKKQGD